MKKAGTAREAVTVQGGAHGAGNWEGKLEMARWRTDLVAWSKKITE